jgi:hypothetical protein
MVMANLLPLTLLGQINIDADTRSSLKSWAAGFPRIRGGDDRASSEMV